LICGNVVVVLLRATDIDNAEKSSSHADGTGANEENFAVQLFQTIGRSVIATICFSNTAFGQSPLLYLCIISLNRVFSLY